MHPHHRILAIAALALLLSSGIAVSWQSRAQTLEQSDCSQYENKLRSFARSGQITSVYHIFFSTKKRACLASSYTYLGGSNAEDLGEIISIENAATGDEQWSQKLPAWVSVQEATDILDKKEADLR